MQHRNPIYKERRKVKRKRKSLLLRSTRKKMRMNMETRSLMKRLSLTL